MRILLLVEVGWRRTSTSTPGLMKQYVFRFDLENQYPATRSTYFPSTNSLKSLVMSSSTCVASVISPAAMVTPSSSMFGKSFSKHM